MTAVLTHSAAVAGKPLRFYLVHEKTFVESEQFEACIGSSRQVRRRHLRKLRSAYHDKVVVTIIDGVETTLMPRWMTEAVVGHGRKYHWLDERTANEFDAALAAAESIARQERLEAA